MESIEKNLPVLIINGATLLVVSVLLIRVLARVLASTTSHLHLAVVSLKDELVGLRTDIRAAGHENALAIGQLTQRVSRIEGKIQGLLLSRAPELADREDDLTPVGVPIPTEDNVIVDPDLMTTPSGKKPGSKTGPVARITPPGMYSVVKPKGG